MRCDKSHFVGDDALGVPHPAVRTFRRGELRSSEKNVGYGAFDGISLPLEGKGDRFSGG